jgi:Protein of unknown function (FYDLN_acid)
MSTVHDRRKALRGTKRTCQACEARFYDLGRNPTEQAARQLPDLSTTIGVEPSYTDDSRLRGALP